jgi:cation diffusion facilitator CzcD-associated flavoprotein CzcO
VSPTQVIVVGAGNAAQTAAAELRAAGITDVQRPGGDVVSSRFDGDTHTWAVRTSTAETFHARVVVAADQPMLVAWTPELAGRNEFRGASFHAAQWDGDFDPTGKHVAVIGTDSTAGHHLGQLTKAAASVTVFAHAPRRLVAELPLPATRLKRWLSRHTRAALGRKLSRPALVGSAISAVTSSDIHTSDGVDHRADAIIYGTGFTIPDQAPELVGAGGLSLTYAWVDGTEPFAGVAIHGFPNYFLITGPDVGARTRYVVECLRLMQHTGSTRIEVLRSSQQVFNERAQLPGAAPLRVASAFDLSSSAPGDDEIYDGAATLTIAGTSHPVRVRLAGRLDPIDGRYHWQGTLFGSAAQPLPDEALKQIRTATLTVDEHSAVARIVEQTPWGTHAVAGVGAPPYAMTKS